MLLSAEEYIKRLSRSEREIFVKGEKVRDFVTHPNIKPVIDSIAFTYELAKEREEYSPLSELVGEKVNRLNFINGTAEDLIARYDFQRELSLRLATCNYRCPGSDIINALFPATKELDARRGTNYHERLLQFLKEVQQNDYACTGSVTDVKGDRSKRPGEVEEGYVHVVEKRKDGIIVSGAKICLSGAFAADVNFVIPTLTLRKGEERFAVAFAVKPEDKGVKYILQNTGCQAKFREGGEFEKGNPYSDRTTCTAIFDNVFIPWERVFFFEDLEAANKTLTYFAIAHRCAGAACKAGFVDSMIGAASLMSKANGLEKDSAIRQKLGEMVAVSEASYGIAIGGAKKGFEDRGVWLPNMLMANAGKIAGIEGFSKALTRLIDIAGGISVAAPSEFDLKNPEIGGLVKKHLRGSQSFTAEERLKIAKFIEFWATSNHLAGAICGGGVPAASLIFLERLADVKLKEGAVKKALGM